MQFSPAQAATIKAFILADPVLAPSINDFAFLYAALNAPSGFIVWRTNAQVDAIQDAIIYGNMTPAQAIPTDTVLNATIWSAKAMACQGKQFNLQNLLLGRQNIDASRPNIRAAFQDCLTAVPSKADGGTQAAGWVAVQAAMQRQATLCEKILASGTGTAQSPGTMTWQGSVRIEEINEIVA